MIQGENYSEERESFGAYGYQEQVFEDEELVSVEEEVYEDDSYYGYDDGMSDDE